MNSEKIYEYLKLQDNNLDFYKRKVEQLEKQIENIKAISKPVNDISLHLDKDSYTKEEIETAYNRMARYEGLEHRTGGLIIDTFVEFLTLKHESIKN